MLICNPTTGSPTITLFQLRSNYRFIFNFLPRELFNSPQMRVLTTKRTDSVQLKRLFERDGRCVQSLTDHSPQRTNLRLLTITTS